MRRWMLVIVLGGLVLLLNVPALALDASASPDAAATSAPRLVVFEMLASPT